MADNIEVGDLVARITFDDTGLNKSMAEIDRQMKLVKSEFDKASTSLQGYGSEEEKLKAKSDSLNKQLQLQQQRVSKLNEEFQRSVQEKGEDARETQNLATKLNQAQTACNKLETELKDVNRQLEEQQKAAAIANSSWGKLSAAFGAAGEKLKSAGKQMTEVGKTMSMKVTAPIAAAGGLILKAGLDFEEAMSKVQAISGATGDDLAALTEQAKELGSSTRFSASEAAAGMEFLARAGWDATEIMDGMPGLLDLAAASAMDLGRAADITSNVMSAFGLAADTAGHVADVFAAAAANANTDVEQLGLAMTYLAPVANTLGWSLEEATAAVMKMSDAGIQGEKAGAAFATSLTRIAKPSKEAQNVIDELGLSFFDMDGNIKPLPQLISDLEKATADLTGEQKAAALSTIFGAEAYKNWAVLLDAGSSSLGSATDMLTKADGAAKKMADTMQANGKGAMTEMKSALEGLGITLSEYLIPAFTSIVQKITEAIRWFNDLDPAIQQIILVVGGIAAAVGPVILVVGQLVSAVGAIVSAFSAASGAIAAAGGVLAVITGPIGLTIAAIAGLAAAAYLIYDNWEYIETFFVDLWNKVSTYMKEEWDKMVEMLTNAWNAVKETATTVWNALVEAVMNIIRPFVEAIMKVWNAVKDDIAKVWNGIKTFFTGWWETIKTIFAGALLLLINLVTGNFDELKTNALAIWEKLKGSLSQMWEGIKTIFSGALSAIKNGISAAWDAIKTLTSTVWNSIKNFVTGIFDKLRTAEEKMTNSIRDGIQKALDWIKGLPSKLTEMGKNIIDGLINGIKDGIGKLKDTVQNISDTISGGIKNFLGINSPSKVTMELGKWTGEGLALGLERTTAAVAQQAAALASAATPDVPAPAPAGGANAQTGDASGGVLSSLFAGAHITFNVRNDNDIRAVAQELFSLQQSAMRGAGLA